MHDCARAAAAASLEGFDEAVAGRHKAASFEGEPGEILDR
jgi:hypothetical protein